jgi:hypothetical protein
MMWQEKLQALKNDSSEDNLNVFYPPVSENELHEAVGNLKFTLAQQLLELYRITDGCLIESNRIYGLKQDEIDGYDIKSCNADNLATLKESCTTHTIEYIFGSNGVGDFLIVDANGKVLTIWQRAPIEAQLLADSVENYLNELFYDARESTE